MSVMCNAYGSQADMGLDANKLQQERHLHDVAVPARFQQHNFPLELRVLLSVGCERRTPSLRPAARHG